MSHAEALDAEDELADYAAEFAKPAGVYMDGNSLGLMCHAADASLREAIDAWRTLAIRGWTEGAEPWFGMARRAATLLAPIVGCEAGDLAVGNSTTVNLHQLLATFGDGSRAGIVMDATHFPTDRYAVESYLRVFQKIPSPNIRLVTPRSSGLLEEHDILSAFPGMGFAVLPAVVYTTGQLLNIKHITAVARSLGVCVAWDCSHSAGVVPHRFHDDDIDLAFGCGYKYLNGGPGAAGWLYVHPRWQNRLPGLAGWFGSDPARQFEMTAEFHPAAGATRFHIGTPNILSTAPLLGSLQLILNAGMERIREKSLWQTAFLITEAKRQLTSFGVRLVTPQEPDRRGGHVTLAHPEAAKLSRALRAQGVVPDFRPPDMLRFAPAPLYTTFAECETAITTLVRILSQQSHLRLPDIDELVT